MKVLLYIALYIVIGFVIAISVSKSIRKERGYSIHSFNDLDSDEQGLTVCSFLLWPIIIILLAIFVAVNLIVIITNRGDKSG